MRRSTISSWICLGSKLIASDRRSISSDRGGCLTKSSALSTLVDDKNSFDDDMGKKSIPSSELSISRLPKISSSSSSSFLKGVKIRSTNISPDKSISCNRPVSAPPEIFTCNGLEGVTVLGVPTLTGEGMEGAASGTEMLDDITSGTQDVVGGATFVLLLFPLSGRGNSSVSFVFWAMDTFCTIVVSISIFLFIASIRSFKVVTSDFSSEFSIPKTAPEDAAASGVGAFLFAAAVPFLEAPAPRGVLLDRLISWSHSGFPRWNFGWRNLQWSAVAASRAGSIRMESLVLILRKA
mmetsp:Transcript_4891/g.10299  ORF Transcript_4891/g.10299 Transcript_4891/m.10299 type:complete len:294 (-) Transcript_4891:437-1318(-)